MRFVQHSFYIFTIIRKLVYNYRNRNNLIVGLSNEMSISFYFILVHLPLFANSHTTQVKKIQNNHFQISLWYNSTNTQEEYQSIMQLFPFMVLPNSMRASMYASSRVKQAIHSQRCIFITMLSNRKENIYTHTEFRRRLDFLQALNFEVCNNTCPLPFVFNQLNVIMEVKEKSKIILLLILHIMFFTFQRHEYKLHLTNMISYYIYK